MTTTSATVSWQTNVPATSQVEFGITTAYGSTSSVDSTMVTSHQQGLSSLKSGTLYHYRVHSTDANNNAAVSYDLTFTTATTPDTTPPTVSITSPASGATVNGTITVAANASDNVGVASVQFLLDGANLGSLDTTSPYSVSWNTATASNASHTLSAIAKDAAGNSMTSAGVTVTVGNVADPSPPTVPTGLTATAISSSQINLSWTASTDNVGVTGYKVFRGGTQIGTSPTTSFSNTGLSASTTYSYTVAAFDAAGNTSAQSASASATTLASSGGGIPPTLGWYQIPSTTLQSVCPPNNFGGSGYAFSDACPYVISAWGGGMADTTRNRLIIWGGGHTNYSGNELYALDLNSLTMQRLNDPALPLATGCPQEALTGPTPNSRHTTDQLAYIAHADRMSAVTGSLAVCGYASQGTWTLNLSTLQWTQMTPSGGQPNYSGGIAATDYDPNTKNVFIHTESYSQFWSYNYDTNTYKLLSGDHTDYHMTAVVDPKRKLFIMFGGDVANDGGVRVVDISGNDPTYTAQNWTSQVTGCGSMVTTDYPGLAYDPIQDRIVGWAGGNTVYLFNPDTKSCTTVSYPNGPGAAQVNGTNKRFRYFPALGVFALVNDAGQNAWTLRMTPSNSTSAALQDFQTRCAQPGVMVCQGFDSAVVATCHPLNYDASGMYAASDNNTTCPVLDSTTSRSGASSILFTVPTNGGSDTTGSWRQFFQSDLAGTETTSEKFSPPGAGGTSGNHFYIQYAQRMDAPFLTQRYAATGGGYTWWKNQIIATWKSSCGSYELTTINAYNEGFPQMYSNCGSELLQTTNPPGSVNNPLLEQGDTPTTGYNCVYGNPTPSSCFYYPANTWITFYYDITLNSTGGANSVVKAYVSVNGQPYQEWINVPNFTQFADTPNFYDMIYLFPYMTGRDPTQTVPQVAHTWYDELVVSTSPIAAPKVPPAN